jgi:hypothetical protein
MDRAGRGGYYGTRPSYDVGAVGVRTALVVALLTIAATTPRA